MYYRLTGHPPIDQRIPILRHDKQPMISREIDTSLLIELLQKSAVEHFTTFRQIEARDFGSVRTIVNRL